MKPVMKLGIAVTVSSTAIALLGAWSMAQRVEQFYQDDPIERWHFEMSDIRVSEFAGREVAFTDAQLPDGRAGLEIRYGQSVLGLPVYTPPAKDLKDLGVYDEWFQPLYFAPIQDGEVAVDWRSGAGVRMVVVNRRTAGYNEATWGLVRVKDWTFDVLELKPDGTIDRRELQFRDRRGNLPIEVELRRQLLADGKPVPEKSVKLSMVEPIEPRTWEWQAALFAVPKLQISRYRFGTDAINGIADPRGTSWTLPVTAFAFLGILAGIALMLSANIGHASIARRWARAEK